MNFFFQNFTIITFESFMFLSIFATLALIGLVILSALLINKLTNTYYKYIKKEPILKAQNIEAYKELKIISLTLFVISSGLVKVIWNFG